MTDITNATRRKASASLASAGVPGVPGSAKPKTQVAPTGSDNGSGKGMTSTSGQAETASTDSALIDQDTPNPVQHRTHDSASPYRA